MREWIRARLLWRGNAPEPGTTGGACTVETAAGVYSSRWGDIACRPGGRGLECCYGAAGCQKMLHLELSTTGRKLVGYWEYRSGQRGPAEFGLTERCELTDGHWGYGSSRANNSWKVAGRK
jgi:hypothetical protein